MVTPQPPKRRVDRALHLLRPQPAALGRRDLGGLRQYLSPFLGLTEDAVAALRLELLGKALHSRFEQGRVRPCLGAALLFLGQALVGEGEGHAVRDQASSSDVS